MNWQAITEELSGDPLERGYAAMSDAAVVVSLNTADRPRLKTQMSGDQIFQQTVAAEFAALTDIKKQLWLSFTGCDVDPSAAPNVTFVQWVFGAGSATVANLAVARQQLITRREELGLPELHAADIARARSMI